MRKYTPPGIEEVNEPFCGCRRKNMIPLADKAPSIAEQWCYEKNCGWEPQHFSHASTVRAWWICLDCHREYKSQINNRVSNESACPYCASKRVCEDNTLEALHPAISREWHYKKNGRLKPSHVTYATSKKVWWKCASCKHTWQARIYARTVHNSCCPKCYERSRSEAKQSPHLHKRRNVTLNAANQISRAWYEKRDFQPLSKTHPKIAAQWHPTKNGSWTTKDFAFGSTIKAWWKCSVGSDHEWQSPIYSRTAKGRGHCPFCNGKKVSVTNSLASLFPQIAKEWHKTKNGNLRASDVTGKSKKLAWWQCRHGHTWQQIIGRRTYRLAGCPECR